MLQRKNARFRRQSTLRGCLLGKDLTAARSRRWAAGLEELESRLAPAIVSLVADIDPNGHSYPLGLTNVNGTRWRGRE